MSSILAKVCSVYQKDVDKCYDNPNVLMADLIQSVKPTGDRLECSIDLFTDSCSSNGGDVQNVKSVATFYYDSERKTLVSSVKKKSAISMELRELEAIGRRFDEFAKKNPEYIKCLSG